MAYKIIVNQACANRAAVVASIHTQMLAMGWTYIDGIVDNPALNIPYSDVSVANDTFTKVGHTLVNGTPVSIMTTGTVPAGLTLTTLYYVVSVSGDTFKLSATYGGTAINITAQGTGNHSIVEGFRIYSSNGELADQITQYVMIYSVGQIMIRAAYSYDLATRTPKAISDSNSDILTTSETGCYLWIHGNKNTVIIMIKTASTYYRCMFGFVKPFYPLYTKLTAGASAGTNITLSVTSSDGFEVGNIYQIVGASQEGRDNVTVTAIGTGTITLLSLPRNYGIDSRIGIAPACFGNSSVSTFYGTCGYDVIGLNTSNYGSSPFSIAIPLTSSDPEMRTQKYILQPLILASEVNTAQSSNYGILGYLDEYLLGSPSVGLVIEDTIAVGKFDSGTSSGSNSTSVLNDTSKAWAVDAYAGKVVIIVFGLGSGMIKKILSNTSTALTLDTDINSFETIPDTTSQYYICDEGYRYMASGTGAGTAPFFAVREGI